MADSTAPDRGTWAAPPPAALRSPCPMINCLANHGYLPRNGREAHTDQFREAMHAVGLSSVLGWIFYRPIFLEYDPGKHPLDEQMIHERAPGKQDTAAPRSFLGHLGYLLSNPLAIPFSSFGMRDRDQKDARSRVSLNLDQIGRPGVVEHDISLTRHDYAQGDNLTRQPELVRELLAASSDGKVLTMEDLAAYRRRRVEEQREINPSARYGDTQNLLACGEIALILMVLGDGRSVKCDYLKAFFEEERLPTHEGWKRREGSNVVGALALNKKTQAVKEAIGLKF